MPIIFAPFEQGAATGQYHFGGLGLGLTISKAIMELHNGSITAFSEGEGRGSTFTVTLPLGEPEADLANGIPARSELHKPVSTLPNPLRILLVEDHAATRDVLTMLLSREGHQVKAVPSFQAAVEAAKTAKASGALPFQVMVTDLGLPDGTGLRLLGEIKGVFPDIIGIAVSGYGTEEDLKKSNEAGFQCHLIKPIRLESLRQALAGQ